jgi:hypothetical protein
MVNALKQKIWWLAVSLAGASQHGETGTGAVAVIIVVVLESAAHAFWLRLWRDRLRRKLAFRRFGIRTDVRSAPSAR